jgi:hypothetical protein
MRRSVVLVDYDNCTEFIPEALRGQNSALSVILFVQKGRKEEVEKSIKKFIISVIETHTETQDEGEDDEDNEYEDDDEDDDDDEDRSMKVNVYQRMLFYLFEELQKNQYYSTDYYLVSGTDKMFDETIALLNTNYRHPAHNSVKSVCGAKKTLLDIFPDFSCEYCSEIFSSQREVDSHKSSGYYSRSTPLKCQHCPTVFRCGKEQADKAKDHTGLWGYKTCIEAGCPVRGCEPHIPCNPRLHPKCPHCEKHFLNEATLKAHFDTGHFENFINTRAAPRSDDPQIARVMKAVTTVAHEFGATAEYAGSRRKHTDVFLYSDVDIFVDTKGQGIDDYWRKWFSKQLIAALTAEGFVNPRHQYKPQATVFTLSRNLSFDLVFSDPSWTLPPVPPDEVPFHGRPHRQRAVRALKLASKLVGFCTELRDRLNPLTRLRVDSQSAADTIWRNLL